MKKFLVICSSPNGKKNSSSLAVYCKTSLEKIIELNRELNGRILIDAIPEIAYTGNPENTPLIKIPRGYDVYFIHPRDIDISDLSLLKLEQPSSIIWCAYRSFGQLTDEERAIYDGNTYLINFGLLKSCLAMLEDRQEKINQRRVENET